MSDRQPSRLLPLHAIAHSRAGDKGNVSNISLIAYKPEAYDFLREQVTAGQSPQALCPFRRNRRQEI